MSTINKPLMLKPNDEGLLAYVESTYDQNQLCEIIWDTQRQHIRPILGSALYDEILSQIQNNNLTQLNTTLLNLYINPVMKFYVSANGLYVFNYKIRQKGMVTMNSDNSNPASISELDRMYKYFDDKGQTDADMLMRYLVENDDNYPLYKDAGDGFDTIHPTGQQYNVGFYMGSYRNGYNPCGTGDENTIDF